MRSRAFQWIRESTSRLLSDDSVFATVQRALLSSLDARRALERNIERLLAGANLPSARDLERISEQLGEIDRDVAGIAQRLAVLGSKLDRDVARADAEKGLRR